METTPHSLLEKLRHSGGDDSWKRFVHLYTPVLLSWASRTGLQDSDAADLVQEVFVILVEELPQFEYDRSGSFRAWLRTVTLNKLRDWKRRHVREATILSDLQQFDAPDAHADTYWEIDFRRELTRRALELMRTEFAPKTWQACWEFIANSSSAAEVSRKFGMSENAVFVAKCRIVRRLRQELRDMLD